MSDLHPGEAFWRKRDGSDIVKLGGPADVRAIFTPARHFDFGPPFAGDPWDDRPALGPNVSRFPSAIPAGEELAMHSCPGKMRGLEYQLAILTDVVETPSDASDHGSFPVASAWPKLPPKLPVRGQNFLPDLFTDY